MNLYWVFLVVLLAACSPNSGNTKEQMVLSPEYTLEIYDEALAKKLQETLNAEGIYYKVIEDNRLKVKTKNRVEIDRLFLELSQKDLPVGRSISLKMPGLEEMVIEELEKNQIPYVRKKRYGDFWIVWLPRDIEKVNKIIEQSSQKARMKLINNLEKGEG